MCFFVRRGGRAATQSKDLSSGFGSAILHGKQDRNAGLKNPALRSNLNRGGAGPPFLDCTPNPPA